MSFVPKAEIYASNGSTLVYTFTAVQDHNLPHSETKFIKQTNFRAGGGIIIPGGETMWEASFKFILFDEDYEDITSFISTLESTVLINTPYYLKVQDSPTTVFNNTAGGYKIKRTAPFEWLERESDLMNGIQVVQARFDVGAW